MDALGQVIATRTMLMRDREGRPLGEAKAGAARMSGVPFELRTCPYPGSRHRHPHPMNLSALKQVSAHWQGVLGALAYLHDQHRRAAGASPPCIVDVWRVGHLTNALADFAFMRTWKPVADGELPATIGALYKVSLGVASTSLGAWAAGAVTFTTPTSVDFLLDHAERHGQLIGPEQVCGGTAAMISELLAVALEGGPPRTGAREAAEVVDDEVRFRRFCDATAALRLLRIAFERLDASLRWQLAAETGSELDADARRALVGELHPEAPLTRFATLDREAQLAVLDDLLAQLADERFPACAGLAAGARALRDGWVREQEVAAVPVAAVVAASGAARALPVAARGRLRRGLARYLWIEQASAALVRELKATVAATLGIDLAAPIARERGLIGFVPARPARPSMRAALRDVFGIAIAAPDGEVTVTCGDIGFALAADQPAALEAHDLVRRPEQR